MLHVLGHLGWPYFDQRLLRLKVVGSKCEARASPEQVILRSAAKDSMASHISLCVILFSLSIFSYFIPGFADTP